MGDDRIDKDKGINQEDDSILTAKDVSRREAMKTALKVGAYAAPVVLAVSLPRSVAAQGGGSGPTGILTGTITNASTGAPISGATVAVGAVSALTNASGVYSIPNAPAGLQSVQTSAAGYTSRTDPVNIVAASTTTFSTGLLPASASGNIAIVLTWGATPTDLDSHLVGPILPSGRFHCYYVTPDPVPYVSLDLDDTSSFGPETIQVSTSGGNMVPGSYSYFVHNYSGSPAFNTSNGIVTVFQGGVQIAQFLVGGATGTPTLPYWSVFGFTLTATPTGQIVISTVQTFTSVAPTLPGLELPTKRFSRRT